MSDLGTSDGRGQSRKKPLIAIAAVMAGVLIFLLGLFTLLTWEIRRGLRVELPPDYQGWVVIQYEDPSCPPLRFDGQYAFNPLLPWRKADRYVVSVPQTGRVCTSTAGQANGATQLWHYHVHPDGRRQKADVRSGGYEWSSRQRIFFVGSKRAIERDQIPPRE